MKKLLAVLSFFFLLVIVGIIALPMLLPVDQLKVALEESVTKATGRDFKINGDVSAKLLPNPAISVSDVTFANASWGKADNMATLERLDIRIALMPALTKHEIKVDEFVVHGLSLNIETGKDGQGNWMFDTAASSQPLATGTDTPATTQGAASDFSITLGDVGIRDGRLSITDLTTGETRVFDDLDIALQVTTLDARAAIEGSATYQKEKLSFTLGLDSPQKVMDGKGFGLDMELSAGKLATLSFKGDAMSTPTDLARGKLNAQVPDISRLVAWATGAPAPEGVPFTTAKFEGGIALSPTAVALDHAALSLDDMSAKGTLSATLGAPRPMIRADLSTGHINLDRFIAKASGTTEETTGKQPKRTKTGWSKEPIAMPALPPVDADITARHEGLTYRTLEMGPATLKVTLKDGKLSADMPDTALLGGTVALNTTYTMKNIKTPQIGVTAKMAGIQVEPVLREFADIDWVVGTGNTSIALTMEGDNMEDLMRTLNGNGNILFTDGELRRFNLGAILEQLKQGTLNTRAGKEQHTVFDKLSGSFIIKSGALSNDDFVMNGPKVTASGKGRVLIVTQKYDYRAVAALLVDKQITKTAADGTSTTETVRVPGFEIPIQISGRFDDPSILPDFKAIVTKALTNPDELKSQVKNLGGEAKKIKEGLKGGDAGALLNTLMGGQAQPEPAPAQETKTDGTATTTQEAPAKEEAPAKPRPEDLIKGLFGN